MPGRSNVNRSTTLYSYHLEQCQPAVIVRDALIELDLVVNPSATPIAKLSLKCIATVCEPNMSCRRLKVSSSSPAKSTVGVGQAVVEIKPRRMMMPIGICTLSDKELVMLQSNVTRRRIEVTSLDRWSVSDLKKHPQS